VTSLTTYERVKRVFEHRDPDRVPITDWIWESTYERWQREGLGAGERFSRRTMIYDMVGMDRIIWLGTNVLDTSPRFAKIIIEESDTYKIERNEWGVTIKNFKPVSSTPQDLAFEITGPDSWRKAKERMTPARDRIDWSILKNYKRWRKEGSWLAVAPWFGFDICNTRMCGTERIMLALAEDPEWCLDMFNSQLDLTLALLETMWDQGYTFDEFLWYDDMAYRRGLFFSPRMFRELIKPYQQRLIDWSHARNIKAHLHCCGNMKALLPELVAMGIDALHPLEVKAEMDPVQVKKDYGKDLVLHGGFDVRNWDDPEKVEHDIRTVLPVLMENSGYIFSSDHSIPDSVSLENYRHIVRLVREVGAY
jgi:uroporphyrinogen decarboxylase